MEFIALDVLASTERAEVFFTQLVEASIDQICEEAYFAEKQQKQITHEKPFDWGRAVLNIGYSN